MRTPTESRPPKVTDPISLLGGAVSSVAALFLGAVIVVVLIGVVARYILHVSLPWSEEVARLLLVWLTFMGAAAATYKRTNIRVDTIYARIPEGRLRFGFEVLSISLTILALGILVWASRPLLFGPSASAISPGSGIEARWTRIALPIAAVAMMVFLLAELRWVAIHRRLRDDGAAGEPRDI